MSVEVLGQHRQSANALIKVKIVERNSIDFLSKTEYSKIRNQPFKFQQNNLSGKREVLLQFTSSQKPKTNTNDISLIDKNSDENFPKLNVINNNENFIGSLSSNNNNLVTGISKNDKLTFIYSDQFLTKKNASFRLTIVY